MNRPLLLKNKRIFMVEDLSACIAVAWLYLQHEGAQVVYDQAERFVPQMILSHPPIDLILLDLVLPNGQDGFEVFDELRQIPQLAHIPVVAVSAYDPQQSIKRAKTKGFAGFIGKPISPLIGHHVADVLCGRPVWEGDDWQFAGRAGYWTEWQERTNAHFPAYLPNR